MIWFGWSLIGGGVLILVLALGALVTLLTRPAVDDPTPGEDE